MQVHNCFEKEINLTRVDNADGCVGNKYIYQCADCGRVYEVNASDFNLLVERPA